MRRLTSCSTLVTHGIRSILTKEEAQEGGVPLCQDEGYQEFSGKLLTW